MAGDVALGQAVELGQADTGTSLPLEEIERPCDDPAGPGHRVHLAGRLADDHAASRRSSSRSTSPPTSSGDGAASTSSTSPRDR